MVDVLERAQVRVGEAAISPARIAEEMQNHPASNANQAWEAAARALVVRELLLGEARRQGFEPGKISDPHGRELGAEDALIETLLEREINVPSANEAEARRYYDSHLDRFTSPLLVEAEHILISASPDDELAFNMALSDARGLIRDLVRDPFRFAELAAAHSACPSKEQGGNLGQIGPGQTVPEFEEVLFGLDEGQLAESPVRSRYGVHVIRAGRRAEARVLPFEAVEQSIRAYLEEASYRRALAQFIAILAGQIEIEGVDLPMADGPLVQ